MTDPSSVSTLDDGAHFSCASSPRLDIIWHLVHRLVMYAFYEQKHEVNQKFLVHFSHL
uniref:Uncharacterized protein n=1 Tax=Arion vulgaris TaxID=1028688 RepID=A0A0B7AJT9_9EUPU